MKKRKELKACAKRTLKKHYWLLLVVCLISAFWGTEYSSVGVVWYRNPAQLMMESEGGRLLQKAGESQVLGRTKGVLAMAVNQLTSGTFVEKIRMGIGNILGSQDMAANLMIILSMLFYLFISIYIQAVYIVIARRIFLEARTYEKVGVQKFLFLMRVRRWSRTAWNMLVLAVYQFLWDLTIIGGFIKHYSYFMVPYILAENPDLKGREALDLSRRMMKGHKWECCKLELSFLPWDLLGLVTFGFLDVLFTNPYETASFGEYYACVRRMAKEKGIPGSEKLNDRCLFEKPSQEELDEAYGDVLAQVYEPLPEAELHGLSGVLSRWFGVVLTNSGAETAYEQAQAEKAKLMQWREILEGKAYPGRLSPIKTMEKRKNLENLETIRYARNYSVASLILLFFTCSFIGWLWEVSLHLITDGVFVNRGVLHGPWLPIYGTGSVLILVILKRFRHRPALEFTAAVVLCGCVEYFTSWYLEVVNGGKWWDYTGYFLNLNGRICAEGLLVFGLGGVAIVYVLAPLLDNLFRRINRRVLLPLCLTLLVVYGADQAYSSKYPNTGKGISDYDSAPQISEAK